MGATARRSTGFAATPERFIEVDWNYTALSGGRGDGKSQHHTARISVIAANEPTALANLTNAIAKQDGAIANLKIVNRQQDFIEVLVDVDVRDVAICRRSSPACAARSASRAWKEARAGVHDSRPRLRHLRHPPHRSGDRAPR